MPIITINGALRPNHIITVKPKQKTAKQTQATANFTPIEKS
jgi:hypothetical protein